MKLFPFKRKSSNQSPAHTSTDAGLSMSLQHFMRSTLQNFINKTNSNTTVTPENAYQISAYWAAVRAISEDIAKLNVKMYSLSSDNRREYIKENPLLNVLTNGFNDEVDSNTGIQTMIHWALTFGNAYCEIVRNLKGDIQFNLLHPSRVTVERNQQTNKLQYRISSAEQGEKKLNNKDMILQEADIFHFKGTGNGIIGFSVGELAAQSLGIAMSSQNFTANFFGNNLQIGTYLKTPRTLSPDDKDAIREDFAKKNKNFSVAVLDRDFELKQLQMASTDAELLSTRKFQIEEIARWFRIPPHKIMDMNSVKYNNLEQNDLNYITDTLTPWIVRLERQLKFKFYRDENIFIDFDEKGLARGDMAARTSYYRSLYDISAITPNEIREAEGLTKSDNEALDQHYQMLNMQSVQQAHEAKELELENAKKQSSEPAKPVAPVVEDDEPEDDDDNTTEQLRLIREQQLLENKSLQLSLREQLEAIKSAQNITLQDIKAELIAELKQKNEPIIEQSEPVKQDNTGIIATYLPTMRLMFEQLVDNEYNTHNLTFATDGFKKKCQDKPEVYKEHLDKFYAKHEGRLSAVIEKCFEFLGSHFGKDCPDATETAKEICNMDKSDGWQDLRVEEICNLILKKIDESAIALQIGEIVKGDDNKTYMVTATGLKEVDVITKNS